MKTDRSGGSESVGAEVAGDADAILSSQGKAKAAPALRKTVLREIRLDMISSFSIGSGNWEDKSRLKAGCSQDWLPHKKSFDHHWDRPLWGRRRRGFHCYVTALTVAEGHTQYYFMHQGARAVVILAERLRQLRDRAAISILQAASQGVSEHFAAQLAQEVVFLIH